MKQHLSSEDRILRQSVQLARAKEHNASFWVRLLNQNSFIILLVAVMGLLLLGAPGAVVAWVMVLLWAVRGVDEAFEALLLSVFITMANPAIFASLPFALLLRWLVFGVAVLRIGYELANAKQAARFPYPMIFWLFVAYTGLSALVVSPLIPFSLIKLAQFAIGVWLIYRGANLLVKQNWIHSIIGFGSVIVVASFVVSLFGFGYERNLRGFQGVTNQPQALGVIIGVTAAVAIAQWLLREGKITPVRAGLLALFVVGLFLSQARIGAVVLIASLVISLLLLLGIYGINWRQILFHPMTYFAAAALLVYWMVNPTIGQDIVAFFEKSSAVDLQQDELLYSTGQLYYASRGTLVDMSLRNFQESPILGVGFGIPSHVPIFESSLAAAVHALPNAVRIGDIVVWSDAEKGFIGTAALEETGVIGAALLALFLLTQLVAVRRRGNIALLTLFIAALSVNIGEAVLFSFGGLGRYVIICMAIAVAAKQPVEE